MAASPRWTFRALGLLALLIGFWAPLTAAQSDGVILVASGLVNPRGLTWNADGALYVALAGVGGDPVAAGLTGSVALIDDGCAAPVADNLPSIRDESGQVGGPAALAFLNGRLYLASNDGGADPDAASGVSVIDTNGGWASIGNLDAWVANHPVAHPVAGDPHSDPVAMLADDQSLVVLERAGGQLLRVGEDGVITRVADFSASGGTVAGLARDADGALVVGVTDRDGAGAVWRVAPDGALAPVWTGLGAVTGVAIAPDGVRYALETPAAADDPLAARDDGRILRQTGPDTAEPLLTGLDRPAAMAFGPDGGLYLTFPTATAPLASGGILRVDPDAAGPLGFDPARFADSRCAPTTGPAASPGSAPSTTAADAGTPDAGAMAVRIADFAFSPPTLDIAAGTTVTWTNADTAPHTATAKDTSFDSGNLDPGDSFAHTFADPGTYDYVCSYHAGMKGTIVVE
ncbi:MAG: ScyD/ScyE family protein [Thermomicrobiales bacterium]|nr:ScyD/ScyE family protein [Thermomicrobiales bacterium]